MVIQFYTTRGTYGCFSNFSRHPFTYKDKFWKTSEHAFQAQKFAGTKFEEAVRYCNMPSDAAQMGRDRSLPLRADWEQVKDSIMEEVLYAKFSQSEELKEVLLSTGDAELVEHTVNDSYWGDGGNGSGKNMLGKLLMKTRERLSNEKSS
jgi:ribA/ribD-fused uncharacterized protein